MRAFARLRGRRGTVASVAGIVAASLAVAGLAYFYEGVTTADVELNGGGVWVTKPTSLLAGRLNYPSQTLDSGLRTKATSFDLSQEAETVLVHDKSNANISVIDTATVTLGDEIAVPAQAQIELGSGTIGILDSSSGKLWTSTIGTISAFNAKDSIPAAELGAGAAMTVASDGTVFGASVETGELVTLAPGTDAVTTAIEGVESDAELSLTAVGDTVVILDKANGTLSIGGAKPIALPANAEGTVLQRPSTDAKTVSYATSEALVSQPLNGDDATVTEAGGAGSAVAPVVLSGCAYAAWTGSGRYVRDCSGTNNDVARDVENLMGDKQATFRVNRSAVVLNDLSTGLVWLVNEDMREVSNWDDITPPPDDSQAEEENDTTEQQLQTEIPERTDINTPPVAVDDTLGVRPGRSVILPVIDNDTDADGDVLSAAVTGDPPPFGTIQPIYAGSALQMAVSPDASGTGTFRYNADDGRGGTDEATVTVAVSPPGSNGPPAQKRPQSVIVEQGATINYNILPGWTDPDGDDLFLRSASIDSDDTVKFRADGLVTVNAVGTSEGRKQVTVVVSDGIEDTEGTLFVDVRPAGTLLPITNQDHVTTLADQSVTVFPLANDISPTGNKLNLAKVEEVSGATATADYVAGSFTFVASVAKTYYVQYLASDGPNSVVGLVRIDVQPASSATLPPVAVRDVALLPAGGIVLADVLQNDTDPNGGLLVIQSIALAPTSGIAVAVLDHNIVRVTDNAGLAAPVTFQYTISNGTATATGEVMVVPVPAPTTLAPPVALDDSAVVRAGDTVTINVLENDFSPSGDPLTVAPDLVAPLPNPKDGQIFVSQKTVRFKAGLEAKTVYATYEVVDSLGQKDAGYITIQIMAIDKATNAPPRPRNVEARTLAGTQVRIPIPLDGIDPDGDYVTLLGQATAPKLGRIDKVGDNYLTYLAYDDSAGTDSFSYRVRDAFGAENTATIRVGVASASTQNQPPDAIKDSAVVQPGRRITVDVLANDTDPDGDELSLVSSGLVLPDDLKASVKSGRVLVTAPNQEGDYTLQYTVSDARGATAIGSLLVNVSRDAEPKRPIARDDIVLPSMLGGKKSIDVPVLKNDEDPDGVASELSIAVESATATVGKESVTVTVGEEPQIITYTVTDLDGLTGSAFIRVPSLAQQGPTLKAGIKPLEVLSGQEATIALGDYVTSPSGKTVRITQADLVSANHAGDSNFVVDEKTMRYVSAAKYYGPDALNFEVTDGSGPDDPNGIKATLVIPITVLPAENQQPKFTGGAVKVAAGEEPATLDLRAASSDPDKGDLAKLAFAVTGKSPDGISSSISDGVLSVTADKSVRKGTTSTLEISVTDGVTAPVVGTVTITVTASTRPLAVANDDEVPKAKQGASTPVSVLANDSNPFPETPLKITGAIVDTGAGSAVVDGTTVIVTPEAKFVGTMVVRYRVQDATKDADREVSGIIRLTVQGKPDAPSIPSVSSVQDKTVVLSWSAGSNNGAEITSFTVKSDKGTSQQCDSTTCTISGLTNDVDYSFTVTATNEVGESDPSPASAAARPDARPGAPSMVSLDYGDGSLTATWADGTNPGSAITNYVLEVSPGGQIEIGAGSKSYQITGLDNRTNYSVRVQAKNKAPEPSDWSGSLSMSPAGSPSAPGAPSVSAAASVGSQSQVTVSWGPPNVVNAEALTGYTLQVKGGASPQTVQLGPNELSANITLQNSESAYTFSVAGKNKSTDAGKTAQNFSADSTPRRAVGAADAPVITSATPGDNLINLAWSGGSGNGASAGEISYLYDLNGNGNWQPAASQVPASNNGSYTVRVIARSSVDGNSYDSAPSAPSAAVAPFGAVQSPATSAAGSARSVTLNWSVPSPNGRPIDRVEIRIDGGGWENVGAAGGARTVGDGYSQTHTIWARAFDTEGQVSVESSASAASGPAPAPALVIRYGSGDWINLSASGLTPNTTYTVQCWVMPTATGQGGRQVGSDLHLTTNGDGAGVWDSPQTCELRGGGYGNLKIGPNVVWSNTIPLHP